jgi:hypothetical protein
MRGRCSLGRISLVIIAAAAAGLTGLGPAAATVATSAVARSPGLGTARAAACRGWRVVRAPSNASLSGVAVVPHSSRAWAAGTYAFGQTSIGGLLLHWNGIRWQRVPSPNPGPTNTSLSAVTAVSHTDAWAVGRYLGARFPFGRNLILHWNGTKWRQVPSPHLGGRRAASSLGGVAAISRSNAWAVGSGSYDSATLILHWNGNAWKLAPSRPGPIYGELRGVAVVSATDAWAVGDTTGPDPVGDSVTLIAHWNGRAWKQVPSPNPETGLYWNDYLYGVAATSATNAWAVGYANYFPQGGEGPLVEQPVPADVPIIAHWNGARWKLVPGPSPNDLYALTAVSATDVWAAGSSGILHWNGTRWKQVPIPNSASGGQLFGVAASRKFVLAVGVIGTHKSLTLYHC